ncbi:MAG: signal peptidase II [Gemmatimonadales bacterium]
MNLTAVKARAFWSAALIFVAADYITKRWAEVHLTPGLAHSIFGNTVRFTLTWNQSSAMGLFSFGPASRWIFSIIAIAMLWVLAALLREAPAAARWRGAALGAVAGGAIGNLIDRVLSARGVTDFIDVGLGHARFWTFNVADIGVTCGAILLALLLWAEERSRTRNRPAEGA